MQRFRATILRCFKAHGRTFPWRETIDPYKILVSEIMLQQTQTYRVEPKYKLFIGKFPSFESLACASVHDVLQAWQGLGYNRRALFLKRTAEIIVRDFKGVLPDVAEKLIELPGIGAATAASILAFAFNKPTVFIETNIRSVFIEFFFKNKKRKIHDREIMPLIQKTLDQKNPRNWYYALMDCGVMLKKTRPNPSRKSRHYHLQTPFKDSDRRIRGLILKTLLKQPALSSAHIAKRLKIDPDRTRRNLKNLIAENFLIKKAAGYAIKNS